MIRRQGMYGQPKDPAAFDRPYKEVHLPIAKKIKGFVRWTVGKGTGTSDGAPAPYCYFADLFAESRQAMEQRV